MLKGVAVDRVVEQYKFVVAIDNCVVLSEVDVLDPIVTNSLNEYLW